MRTFLVTLAVIIAGALLWGLSHKFSEERKQLPEPASVQTTQPLRSETAEDATPDQPSEPWNGSIAVATPILMFHYIRDYHDQNDPIGVNLSVSPERFETMLAWLADHHYQNRDFGELANAGAPDMKPVIITLDDGYDDAYSAAFPLLQRYGFSATFYLIVDKVGTPGYLTWEEIKTMQSAGMHFGSHTLTHPNLTQLGSAAADQEITESKRTLEEHLGTPIRDFCYPSGKYDEAVKKLVQQAGYQSAVTTASGAAVPSSDPLALPRLRMTNETNLEGLLGQE